MIKTLEISSCAVVAENPVPNECDAYLMDVWEPTWRMEAFSFILAMIEFRWIVNILHILIKIFYCVAQGDALQQGT